MIVWIASSNSAERTLIRNAASTAVSRLSDEVMELTEIPDESLLPAPAAGKNTPDLFCLDFSMDAAPAYAEQLRSKSGSWLLIVIAPEGMSPMVYLRPSLMAGGLLLRPLRTDQTFEVLRAAVRWSLRSRKTQSEELLPIQTRDGKVFLRLIDILYIEASARHLRAVTASREYEFNGTLDALENTLPNSFGRCHRGFIVRLDAVRSVQLNAGILTLETGEELPLGRSYKPLFKNMGGKDG